MIQPFIYTMGDSIEPVFEPTAGVGEHLVVFATVRDQFANETRKPSRAGLRASGSVCSGGPTRTTAKTRSTSRPK